MSPNEYKQMVMNDFYPALQKKCEEGGITCQIASDPMVQMQYGGNGTVFLLNHEAYLVYNDGNRCEWEFLGVRR